VNVDCILFQLYGLIGLHLRVIMRMREEGEIETYFLGSALFLGVGSGSRTLELMQWLDNSCLNVSLRFMRVILGKIIRGL
jgi:hypothetical protein